MAENETQENFKLLVRKVVLKTFGQERFTQDSPILPDVWLKYATAAKDERIDLILTPKSGTPPGPIARYIADILTGDAKPSLQSDVSPKTDSEPGFRDYSNRDVLIGHGADDLGLKKTTRDELQIAANRNSICVNLTLREALILLIPLTGWWNDVYQQQNQEDVNYKESGNRFKATYNFLVNPKSNSECFSKFISMHGLWDLVRFLALADFCLFCQNRKSIKVKINAAKNLLKSLSNNDCSWMQFKTTFSPLLEIFAKSMRVANYAEKSERETKRESLLLWSISLNREAFLSVNASHRTIKADAARTLFGISAKNITWAVVDSGIDATHPAFAIRTDDTPLPKGEPIPPKQSRVTKTYDFTRLRELLATGTVKDWNNTNGTPTAIDSDTLEELNDRIRAGYDLDWELVAPFLEIPHDKDYPPPVNPHGTHVAGIIGGFWKNEENPGKVDITGVAPDISLMDIRVFNDQGKSEEFAITSALQFLIHLNRRRDHPEVHGVNLSMSLAHEVKSHACGQTPICQECNRLGSNGLLIVAAAGNRGIEDGTGTGGVYENYRDISITDPGNADGVITVGATHRLEPHTYGVSYFSGRGPTGDGRRKPDLVAPGEKIQSAVPNMGTQLMDGTSMAAPHVSGAAALLMARHSELVGHPHRIKEILCQTATDLGREHYFQGHGLVDILRALQSV